MGSKLLICMLLVLPVATGCGTIEPGNGVKPDSTLQNSNQVASWVKISREEAVKEAESKFSLHGKNLLGCSDGMSWAVYDPESELEYYFSKFDGRYLGTQALKTNLSTRAQQSVPRSPVKTAAAAKVAARNFVLDNVMDRYLPRSWEKDTFAEVCKMPHMWRVVFTPIWIKGIKSKRDLNSFPNFYSMRVVIDEASGQVSYFNAPLFIKKPKP